MTPLSNRLAANTSENEQERRGAERSLEQESRVPSACAATTGTATKHDQQNLRREAEGKLRPQSSDARWVYIYCAYTLPLLTSVVERDMH